jgi:hypothetical protein
MVKLKSPCELVVWTILPNIRAELARNLIKLGMSQREVAVQLGMSEAAISQYTKGKRGGKVEFTKVIRKEIAELASEMAEHEDFEDLIFRICRICSQIKADSTLCGPHVSLGMAPRGCDACARLYQHED